MDGPGSSWAKAGNGSLELHYFQCKPNAAKGLPGLKPWVLWLI